MHVGLSVIFQNLGDSRTDRDVYRSELALAARAEPDGFDSVWIPEHHFTNYMLTPNLPQFLSWVAAKTERVGLGTMVSVLPWHDPVRVAEQFALLDHLSDGRAILGIGRGLGQSEFVGFRSEMGESRRRFTEYTEAILTALETGTISYEGDLYQQPPVDIRPRPFKSFRGRTFASAISPESIDLMARLGVGLMLIAQKPWNLVVEELDAYRVKYLETSGEPAPKPILALFVGCHADPAEAQRHRDEYLQGYARSTTDHYEFTRAEFAEIEGYEYYAGLARNIEKHGLDGFNSFLADLQIWGTPDEVVAQILDKVALTDAGGLILVTSFGGMSAEVARANYEIIASDVLPHLKAHDVGGDLGSEARWIRYRREGLDVDAVAGRYPVTVAVTVAWRSRLDDPTEIS